MKHNVGGGEVTNDFYTVSVTGAFTITCTFDRLYHPDGKGFSDEEMIAVGKDYISNENFRIGRDTNTDSYFITGPQPLTKDVAAKLIQDHLIATFTKDLKNATAEGSMSEAVQIESDIKHFYLCETYDEIRECFIETVRLFEPRREDLANELLALLVNEGDTT